MSFRGKLLEVISRRMHRHERLTLYRNCVSDVTVEQIYSRVVLFLAQGAISMTEGTIYD